MSCAHAHHLEQQSKAVRNIDQSSCIYGNLHLRIIINYMWGRGTVNLRVLKVKWNIFFLSVLMSFALLWQLAFGLKDEGSIISFVPF